MNENDCAASSRLSSLSLAGSKNSASTQVWPPTNLTAISVTSAETLRQFTHYRDLNDREFPHLAHKRLLWDAQCDKTIFGTDRRRAARCRNGLLSASWRQRSPRR